MRLILSTRQRRHLYFYSSHPIRPARQAGHKSLLQFVVSERSLRKKVFSLASNSVVFRVILICWIELNWVELNTVCYVLWIYVELSWIFFIFLLLSSIIRFQNSSHLHTYMEIYSLNIYYANLLLQLLYICSYTF